MPLFLAAFLGGLVTAASSIVGRVLVSMGVGLVVFNGVGAMLDSLKASVMSNMGALPGEAVQILGLMKTDVCVSVLFSAVAARLLLNGLTGGTLKRWVTK